MFDTIKYANMDRAYQEKMLKLYQRAIRRFPSGGLASFVVNGKTYYKLIGNEKLGMPKKYLGNDNNEMVRKLKTRKFLEEEIKIIEDNLKVFDYLEKHYKSCDPNIICEDMKRAYKALPIECFQMSGIIKHNGWGSGCYEKGDMFPENLKHLSLKGDMVRSKSELTIVNMLFQRKIEYRYEEVIFIGGHKIVPDVTVLDPITKQLIYWEHAGMTMDDDYMNRHYWKLELYRQNGIVPWKNLIVTYDDEEGNLDAQYISRLCDLWFEK